MIEEQPSRRSSRPAPAVKHARALMIVRDRIRDRWDELPTHFSTLDVFEFFDRSEREMARACANLALRAMERAGRVDCLGRGRLNACQWVKRQPAADPSGHADPAVRHLAGVIEGLPEGDPLRRQCEMVIRNLCDRFGVNAPKSIPPRTAAPGTLAAGA